MPKMRRGRPNGPQVGSSAALKMEAAQLKADKEAGMPSKAPDVGRSGNRKVKKAGLGGHKGY